MSLGENRTHRTVSRHQAARKSPPCSGPDFALEDNIPGFDMDSEVHSTLVSPCPAAVVHWHNHLPTSFALGRDLSSGVQLSASHSRTTQQDLIKSRGMHSTQPNVVVPELVIAALYSRKMAFEPQCFAAEESASVGPLVKP